MASTVSRSGGRLHRSGRPSVAVDVALLTLAPDDAGRSVLSVLEVRRDGDRGWQLPSTYLRDQEKVSDAVLRCLRERADVNAVNPQQLQVFDDLNRDGLGWTLAMAYVDVAPPESMDARADSSRIVAADAPGRLPDAHGEIVRLAVDGLRTRYAGAPDPAHLLSDTFTLRELRLAHESVAGHELQRDTFRRVMEPLLLRTGETALGARGRPAEIFCRG